MVNSFVVLPEPRYPQKIADAGHALSRIALLARPLVFTNGVFDILHRGHVTYLEQAKALGASLVVAVNSDASAKRLGKGADRPLNGEEDRMAVLAALTSVDLVVAFDADTPRELIIGCAPDVLVKGGD
jgi:rfaE bifunctional protein nucleotidyltransferase chain/domain